MLHKKTILGIGVTNENGRDILEYIVESLHKNDSPYYIVTPNPEMIVLANKDKRFLSVLNSAGVSLADGIGLVVAADILGQNLKEKITGVDFMENLCRRVAEFNNQNVKKPITVGFLGGGRGVADRVAECLTTSYPGLRVGFVGQEWGEERLSLTRASQDLKIKDQAKKHEDNKEEIHDSEYIDILFVAFGFPKQEFWMADHIGKIPVKVMMGVGGAFDYLSGDVPRAPKLMRNYGLEWLYRLVMQPWRFKRQLSLVTFITLVLSARFSYRKS